MRLRSTSYIFGLSAALAACGGGSSAPMLTVGGSLSGVAGSGLTLQLNGGDSLMLSADGNFVFSNPVAAGSSYVVTIETQPANPAQTCVATNASGTIASSSVTNVAIACTTNKYAVGGTVEGLAGSGLVLENNDGDDFGVAANGSFSFSNRAVPGGAFLVTIKSQPVNPSQTCVVANASGTVGNADVASVVVNCMTNSYPVGGTVAGLVGAGLVLDINGGGNLPIAGNGSFTFLGSFPSGSKITVAVEAPPFSPSQTCTVTTPTGVISGEPVTNVMVICTTNSYTIGGTVTGLSGSGLVLEVNGGQNLPVAANGAFVFPTGLPDQSPYAVTIKAQPSPTREVCAVNNATGNINAASIGNVAINCATVAGFIYTPAIGLSANQIVTYGISPGTGAPVPLNSPVATGSMPISLVASANGNFLFVANAGSNDISTFAVDSSHGALTLVGSPVAVNSKPQSMVLAASGKFLFVGGVLPTAVSGYSVNSSTGTLTPLATGLAFNANIVTMAATPTGAFLYVLTFVSGTNVTPPTVSVTAYAIDPTSGALTAGLAITPPVNSTPVMTIDPLGRFLFLTSSQTTALNAAATILPYAIDPQTGALTAVGVGTMVASNAGALAADPTGKYLYIASDFNFTAADDNIIALSIDQSTGALTQIGSPLQIGSDPGSVICDPSGQFVFAGNVSQAAVNPFWYDLSAFTIAPSGVNAGQLTPSGEGTLLQPSQVRNAPIVIIE